MTSPDQSTFTWDGDYASALKIINGCAALGITAHHFKATPPEGSAEVGYEYLVLVTPDGTTYRLSPGSTYVGGQQ